MSNNQWMHRANSNSSIVQYHTSSVITNENFEMSEICRLKSATMKIEQVSLNTNIENDINDTFVDNQNNEQTTITLNGSNQSSDYFDSNENILKKSIDKVLNDSGKSSTSNISQNNEIPNTEINTCPDSVHSNGLNGYDNSNGTTLPPNETAQIDSPPELPLNDSNSECIVQSNRNSNIEKQNKENGLGIFNNKIELPKNLPFPILAGEVLCYQDEISDGIIYLTNYRLFVMPSCKISDCQRKNYQQQQQEQLINLPVNGIDSVEIRDLYFLIVFTKYIQSFILTFQSAESASVWHKRLSDVQHIKISDLFCFQIFKNLNCDLYALDNQSLELITINKHVIEAYRNPHGIIYEEFKRMKFDHKNWKICELNKDFKFCNSYPQYFIVPNELSEKDLECVANFRYSRRIPVVVWRSQRNGCVIVRSSQPVVGWLGWRSSQDERLLQKILKICNRDTQAFYTNMDKSKELEHSNYSQIDSSPKPNGDLLTNGLSNKCPSAENAPNIGQANGCQTVNNGSVMSTNITHSSEKLDDDSNVNKLLILDARSYTAAFANRAMGGGCECPEYYLNCDVQFMGLNNIHSIRKSFYALRYICEAAQIDQSNWFTLLDNTKWFHNLASLLKAAVVVVDAISIHERPVLVHCSDGWDRTPQVVALAELMLDPYYRTIDGFIVLIEREWLQFGHKFADRCRSSSLNIDPNERCPVFLQWLDCVHQLHKQFPREFEFNVYFLIKLVYHSYSCLFGTFTCNNVQERQSHQIYDKTISLWSYFRMERNNFINYLYLPNQEVLRPSYRVKDIVFWNEVYVPVSNTSMNGIIPYNYYCNQHLNNNQSIFVTKNHDLSSNSLNEANIDESRIEFNCDHDIKCYSRSKCDLTRSASYENISSVCSKNKSLSDYENPGESSTSVKPNLNRKPRIRHLSDSCLFDANEIPNDRDNFLSSSSRNNESVCDNDELDSKNADLQYESNDIHNKELPADCETTISCQTKLNCGYKSQSKDILKFCDNEIDYGNGLFSTEPTSHPKLQSNTQKVDNITLFDIDGQIIVKSNSFNSQIQIKQLIAYHKRMAKCLTYQLLITKAVEQE